MFCECAHLSTPGSRRPQNPAFQAWGRLREFLSYKTARRKGCKDVPYTKHLSQESGHYEGQTNMFCECAHLSTPGSRQPPNFAFQELAVGESGLNFLAKLPHRLPTKIGTFLTSTRTINSFRTNFEKRS